MAASDVVTILNATYKPDRDELKIQATSSEQPNAVLSVVGLGAMTFRKNNYELKIKPLGSPPPFTVIVQSNLGGSATSQVAGVDAPPPPGPAIAPNPIDGETNVATALVLSWTAGLTASSHDVYFGTRPDLDAAEFQGNQILSFLQSPPLERGTTYFWRIDGVNDNGTTTGSVWSFTTEPPPGQPGPAENPVPSTGSTNVSSDAVLSWTAGSLASSHDVYFGPDPALGPAAFQLNQVGTTFDPGPLASDTTYFWRIDEVNANGTSTGAVWTFTTISGVVDEVTILEATYNPRRDELKITARSSAQPDAVLTVEGFGVMRFRKDRYELKIRPLSPSEPPLQVTVTSSLGSSAVALVQIR